MIALLLVADLAIAAAATWPTYLDAEAAQEHAWHAERAAVDMVPAELLIAVAAVETHFDAKRVSLVRGKRFCGPVQAQAGRSKRRCRELQALGEGYATGARELADWLRYTKGDLPAALRGYACGVRARLTCGSHGGRKLPYHERVLRGLRRLQAARAAAEVRT